MISRHGTSRAAGSNPFFSILCALALLLSHLASLTTAANSARAHVLIIARDVNAARTAHSGLQGYGIPYRVLVVPKTGATLPQLNSSATEGNYGGIAVLSDVSYDYGEGQFRSALTEDQWNELYAYQAAFKVRMVRLDVYPGPQFGVETAIEKTGCCNAGNEQLIYISNNTGFPTANVKTYAGLSTQGMWHYPAKIVNTSWTWEVAKFQPAEQFRTSTIAGVVNRIEGREQMVFFIGWATDWSSTSNFLQHPWIHWLTRGLYTGFRRLYLNTQVDDMFLITDLYQPAGSTFRIRPADLEAHIGWMRDINSRLPAGSNYKIEIGHNGNGDIEAAVALNTQGYCNPIEAIEYPDQVDTILEFVKPPGTGTDLWPPTPVTYRWTVSCANLDPLMQWFRNPSKRDAFMHVSHTFTHEALNNATYDDCAKEISFNRAWLQQAGFSQAMQFSSAGLIPPAITGLHNADAIKAWMDNGIRFVVGDNTRPILGNQQNPFWPLISTYQMNGYPGLTVMPRWATTIYYNCDLPDCTLQEWINTSGGAGSFQDLLDNARNTNTMHLLSLRWDPFMFHQANLRQIDVDETWVNGAYKQYSLLQIWVEIIVQEMTRLTDWPIITKKHDDLAQMFLDRMARDQCSPFITWNYSADGNSVVSVTMGTATGNTCPVPIPLTVPASIKAAPAGSMAEKAGNDPLTVWVKLNGRPVTLELSTPMRLV